MMTEKARLLTILTDPSTTALDYFTVLDGGIPAFTGSRFESLGGGGDAPDVKDRLTATDILAVETLGVRIPSLAVLRMLERDAEELAQMLRAIPSNVTISSDEGRGLLKKQGAPDKLWKYFMNLPGVGWVTAGKLCARKRPALVPVFDDVVKKALDPPFKDWWTAAADLLSDDDIVGRTDSIRDEINALDSRRPDDPPVTRLRTVDIAVWMRQHGYQWSTLHNRPSGPLKLGE